MDSGDGFMDAGTYAWIVIISFFLVFTALQIRNCLRNVRGNSENSFADVCPDQCEPSTSTGQGSSVYTIDIGDGQMPSNYLNTGYSVAETGRKTSQPNDGLPSYEEAVGKTAPRAVVSPVAPPPSAPTATTSAQSVQPAVSASEISETGRGHWHRRHHRRHRHHRDDTDSSEPHEDRRRNRRRGFKLRRHLAKMGRNHPDQNQQ